MGSAVKPPPPPRLHFHKESFPSTESCLPDSLLCFLLPLPSPRAHPHPVLLVCNGAWRQMRSFDIQTEIQEDRAQIKKKRAHSFLWASSPTLSRCEVHAGTLTVECVHTSMLLSLRRCLCCLTWYFFSSFQAADYSVSALGNVILAPLFVVLMYLESPPPPPPPSTPPLGQQLFFISLWKLVKCYRVRVSRAAQEGAGCVD